ncbi:Protein of unknown function [Gryllus bimaculatus]|nr:Protein of unknown function [Gryllus bimaculatus]
MTLQQP